MDFMHYVVCMYKSYVIPVGAMSVCWSSKKKLTAGAWTLTAGEQLCRRAVSTQRKEYAYCETRSE